MHNRGTEKIESFPGPHRFEHIHPDERHIDSVEPTNPVVRMINRALFSFRERIAPSPSAVIVESLYDDGLCSRVGLGFSDAPAHIDETLARLREEIVAETELSQEKQSEIIATMAATAIATGQYFPDGNKRTARGVFGLQRLVGKTPSEAILQGVNSEFDFAVPEELEQTILLQNMTRLLSDTPKAVTTFGATFVSEETCDLFDRGRRTLDAVRGFDGLTDAEKGLLDAHPGVLTKDRLFDIRAFTLRENLGIEKKVSKKYHPTLQAMLLQKDYGPALVALMISDGVGLDELSDTVAENLIWTGYALLEMRVKSLATIVAGDGNYAVVSENPNPNGSERTLRRERWIPHGQLDDA